MPNTFSIHYFSTASTYTNKHTETLPAPLPLSKLFETLETLYPGIRGKVLVSCGVSLREEYVDVEEAESEAAKGVDGGVIIGAGDEVAIIPPFGNIE
ncbi:hypothetical protein MW887_005588 [Aspergillus wentii]|nr:hypothetical protein MW887_005588 [Aspergillus wentii]